MELLRLSNIVLILLTFAAGSALAQKDEPAKPIEHIQVVPLLGSAGKYRPKISLQAAIKIAEKFIEKEKINLSEFYLYQAKYILYGSGDNRKPAWYLWWVNEDGGLGNYVEIVVLTESGDVQRLPSM